MGIVGLGKNIQLPRPSREKISPKNLHITFIHTPVSAVRVEPRKKQWEAFDDQYFPAHPGLRPMKGDLWELPHWMHWLGGVLVDQGFSNLRVTDFYDAQHVLDDRNNMDKERVKTILSEQGPSDVYLFSPMTPNLHHAFDIADAIKETYPNSVTIFGGIVATPLKEEVAIYPSVDYVVYGRGEVVLPVLLDAIYRGEEPDVSRIGNLIYRCNGKIKKSIGSYEELPLSALPFPKIDLFSTAVGESIRYLRQVHRLGCPHKCSFCTIQTNGREPKQFSVRRNLAEIDAYRGHYGQHLNIYWGDETFDPKKAAPLLDALKQRGDVLSDFQTRIGNLTDLNWIRRLKESGFVWAEVGLETSDQKVRSFNKGTVKDVPKNVPIEDIFKMIRDEGIAVCVYTMNGLPQQTPDDMRRSIERVCKWITDSTIQAAYHFGAVPYPGSAWHDHPQQFGMRLLHKDYSRYHEDLPPVFETLHAKPDEVYRVFLENIKELGQAMSKPPYFGIPRTPEERETSSETWKGAHI